MPVLLSDSKDNSPSELKALMQERPPGDQRSADAPSEACGT
jgi:hypothetical protein